MGALTSATTQRNNKSEFDKLVSQARTAPAKHKSSLAGASPASSSLVSSKPAVDSPEDMAEADVILVDSEAERKKC